MSTVVNWDDTEDDCYDDDLDLGCGDSYCHICGDAYDPNEFPDDEEDED